MKDEDVVVIEGRLVYTMVGVLIVLLAIAAAAAASADQDAMGDREELQRLQWKSG